MQFHTPEQIAEFTYKLYKSDKPVGMVDLSTMEFIICDAIHASASI